MELNQVRQEMVGDKFRVAIEPNQRQRREPANCKRKVKLKQLTEIVEREGAMTKYKESNWVSGIRVPFDWNQTGKQLSKGKLWELKLRAWEDKFLWR